MKHIGKQIVCDRCGKTIFLKYLSTKALDGGYTPIEQFENVPEGWMIGESIIGYGYKDLCPCCSDIAMKMNAKFMTNRD